MYISMPAVISMIVIMVLYFGVIYLGVILEKARTIRKNAKDDFRKVEEPLPYIMTQEEVSAIDDSIEIDKFMKDVFRIYKEYEEAKQHFEYDKLELLLGHDLKVLSIEKIQELEKNNQQVMYKNITSCGGGITHIYKYGPIEKIDVLLNVNRICYFINRKNKNLIAGDREQSYRVTYRLTFEKTMNGYPSNCPSCGASLNINEEAKCVFCGSFISNTYGDYKLIFKETIRKEKND